MEHEDLAKQITALEVATGGRFHSIDLRLTKAEVEQAIMAKQLLEFKGDLKQIQEGVKRTHSQAVQAISEIHGLRESGAFAFKVGVVIFTVGLSIIGLMLNIHL